MTCGDAELAPSPVGRGDGSNGSGWLGSSLSIWLPLRSPLVGSMERRTVTAEAAERRRDLNYGEGQDVSGLDGEHPVGACLEKMAGVASRQAREAGVAGAAWRRRGATM